MCWLIEHLDSLIVAIATCLAAYFAFRSARMSEIANKAQFSPLLIPSDISYISAGHFTENGKPSDSDFSIQMQNRSEYGNAFAKNIQIRVNDELWWELGTLEPGESAMPRRQSITPEQILSKKLEISYEDILGNKFNTICLLSDKIEKKSRIHSSATTVRFDWKYVQL